VTTTPLAPLLQRFFTQRLLGQLAASPHTVACYRDAFRLLLRFVSARLPCAPSKLAVEDLDSPLLGEFLEHLERDRLCSTRTRNVRLSALRAFFRFVALEEPSLALHCQRVLAIPAKRAQRPLVQFLVGDEIAALVASPDTTTWIGRRDRALLLLAARTGLRNAELTGLRRRDVVLGTGAHVRCHGKGRKTRCTPLHTEVVPVLCAWIKECDPDPTAFVFPSSRGGRLSPDALQCLVARHAATATTRCPSLVGKRVTPHTLRHSTAMEMLHSGIDRTVIALWLGHESVETTQCYLHADMRLKEQAIAHLDDYGVTPGRFRPDDALLAFLERL